MHAPELVFKDLFAQLGILHDFTCIETPEQNAIAERKHQHLLNVARALFFQAKLPIKFWSECIMTATFLINRTPTPLLQNKTPYELLFGTTPDYSNLRNFGCLVFASTLTAHRTKFAPREKSCVFLGYPQGVKGYKLYDLNSKQIFISRNVIFHEHIYPFKTLNTDHNVIDPFSNMVFPSPIISNTPISDFPTDIHLNDNTDDNMQEPITETIDTSASVPVDHNTDPPTTEVPLRRTSRQSKPLAYLKDYECHSILQDQKSTPHPLSKFISYDKLSDTHRAFILAVTALFEPRNYKQARQHKIWNQAMQTELYALLKNKTWTYVKLPPNKRVIGCRWVYKIKYNSDGSVERCKARLVAQGFSQQEGLDFFDTFSPVAKMVTFKLLLAISAIQNWHTLQIDINNAFLNGDLNEEVYMVLPPGLSLGNTVDNDSTLVCKLNKSIYGLKQSSRQWYKKLSDALIMEGFQQSQADYTLFTKGSGNNFIALLVYVDDIIIAGPNNQLLHQLQDSLHNQFKLKALGPLKYFPGFEIARSPEGIFLSQRKYTLQLLTDTGFTGSKPAKTPMDPKARLDDTEGTTLEDPSAYRQLVGRVLYLTLSRPDITYAVNILSQFMASPRTPHMQAVHHLLRYLKRCPGQALPISSLFPFLYFMIRDFGIAKKDEDIGYYAGAVGCAFMFGRFLTSIFWGMIADRYGRKPVLIFGTISVVIFNTLFGLSTNFWMAISTRFLLGSLCGILGPMRAYASEICRKEYQALGMSIISTAWGIGLVIGPALGGFLAQPAEKFPRIFSKESLFGRFPYFLPCLVISTFALVVTILCYWLPETLHFHCKKDEENLEEDNDMGKCNHPQKQSLYKNWPLMSSIMVYCVFQLQDMAYSEIFPLWAVSPKKYGGLSYSSEQVGEVLAISGFAMLVFQLFLYPSIERSFGPVHLARIGAVITIVVLSSYPFIAKFSGLTLTLLVDLAAMLKNVISVCITTGLFLLQNRAVSQSQRGAANGISMAAMSLFKAIGPAGGGVIFSWAQNHQNGSFLPGDHLVFFILNVVEFIAFAMTFKPFLVLTDVT
uniref:Major facilitator superfamily (MFS) profile domain-containing protein n=1 Tax=Cannabis sativa TaxID=3483 RepID=A0A803Q474_CANSA